MFDKDGKNVFTYMLEIMLEIQYSPYPELQFKLYRL